MYFEIRFIFSGTPTRFIVPQFYFGFCGKV